MVLPDTESICSNLTANTGSSTLLSRHFNMGQTSKAKTSKNNARPNPIRDKKEMQQPKRKKPAPKNMRVSLSLSPTRNKRKAKVSPTQQSEDEYASGSDDDDEDEEVLYEERRKRGKKQELSDNEDECDMATNNGHGYETEEEDDKDEESDDDKCDNVEDMRRELQESRREIAKLMQEVESRKLETAFAKGKRGKVKYSQEQKQLLGETRAVMKTNIFGIVKFPVAGWDKYNECPNTTVCGRILSLIKLPTRADTNMKYEIWDGTIRPEIGKMLCDLKNTMTQSMREQHKGE